jgi:Xaa-Pro aminopeptidase
MFESRVYVERRRRLRKAVGDGVILWLGHDAQPRTYPANTYRFRQHSHFLYYVGLAEPGLAVMSFTDAERDVLFAAPVTMDDVIWSGPLPTPEERAAAAGIAETAAPAELAARVASLRAAGVPIHYVAPFQADAKLRLAGLLGVPVEALAPGESLALKRAVVDHRSHKAPEEVAEIEEALGVTAKMYAEAMRMTRPGLREREIAGAMQGIALAHDRAQCFQPIVTVRGQILHNESYDGLLQPGRLLLIDSGVESPNGYASDITRTVPVSGTFESRQKDLYELVLAMQTDAIDRAKPGVTNRDLHLGAARVLARGLTDLGLMRGDPAAAVEAGAHALFFPHGLGHVLGLDVHDMEDLGDIVGYGEGAARSTQFGLNFLRMARPLDPGFVFTVEPGIYFVPPLIDLWRGEGRHRDFIDYERVEGYRDFGGIRIEDDVLITGRGGRVLGPRIPKTVPEVEAAVGR